MRTLALTMAIILMAWAPGCSLYVEMDEGSASGDECELRTFRSGVPGYPFDVDRPEDFFDLDDFNYAIQPMFDRAQWIDAALANWRGRFGVAPGAGPGSGIGP
ncbi:hypothetical protein [Haliangium sp.]|uniref:hypothetical protein n=1 Tax=Haliangium sp. TaxID=2663208 RepID=UPI003D09A5D0